MLTRQNKCSQKIGIEIMKYGQSTSLLYRLRFFLSYYFDYYYEHLIRLSKHKTLASCLLIFKQSQRTFSFTEHASGLAE